MPALTRRLGRSRLGKDGDRIDLSGINRVLVCRPNHRLGNQLLITPLLAEISRLLPDARTDLFVKGRAGFELFKTYAVVDRIIALPRKPLRNIFSYVAGWLKIFFRRYDVVINAVHSSSSGRIAAHLANARIRLLGEIDPINRLRLADCRHMAKYPVYSLRSFLDPAGRTIEVSPLDIRLTDKEWLQGKQRLLDLVQNDKPTLAIYTYATGVKRYDATWWNEFYQGLLERLSSCNIVEILPVENVSQIGFAAPSYYSKDLRDIAALISHVHLFIGADSGMMHLASAAKTKVIGLFKADNMDIYAPYSNGSMGVDTRKVGLPELIEIVAKQFQAAPSAVER